MRETLKRLAIALGAITAWGLVTSGMEARDAEITAAAEQAAYERVITYRLPNGEVFEALVPIQYTATATQCSAKHGCKTRHYSPRER